MFLFKESEEDEMDGETKSLMQGKFKMDKVMMG